MKQRYREDLTDEEIDSLCFSNDFKDIDKFCEEIEKENEFNKLIEKDLLRLYKADLKKYGIKYGKNFRRN